MKLIIQIPCYNEEKTLPVTYKEIPESIGGIDEIEILVIDDGSADNTVETAKNLGIKHIVSHSKNLGLARAFDTGLKTSIKSMNSPYSSLTSSYGAFFLKLSNNPSSNNSNIRSFTFDIFFPNSLE